MGDGFSAGHVGSLDGDHFQSVSKAWELEGKPLKEASWKMIPKADFIAFLGANPYQTQPVLSTLVRRSIFDRAIPVAVLGEMDCMPLFAAFHFPVKGEKLAVLIKAFLAEVTARPKKTPQKGKRSLQGREIGAGTSSLLKGVGLPKAAQKAFLEMVEAFIKASNPLLLVGEAITGMKNPLAFQDAVNLALSKGLDSGGVLKLMVL